MSASNNASSPPPLARQSRWYFGGVAGCMAACCTHPLDLLKVHLQTQQRADLGLAGMARNVLRHDGLLALYNGISASLLRQMTYTVTRVSLYEAYKNWRVRDGRIRISDVSFLERAGAAMTAGFIGGVVGNPADMVNVRMQNDMKLEKNLRRNYRHAGHGLVSVLRTEGVAVLFSGVSMTATRAAFMTLGQLACYDVFKSMLLNTGLFGDNVVVHVTASVGAAGTATLLTQPFDVMKTRLMNSPPGTYKGLLDCAKDLAFTGPLGFFKGLSPAFIRLGPHTVLLFVFLEKLKENFGYIPQKQ